MRFALLALLTVGAVTTLVIRGVADTHEDVFTSYKLDPVRQHREALLEEISRLNIDREALLEPGRLSRAAKARGLYIPHEVISVPVTPLAVAPAVGELEGAR